MASRKDGAASRQAAHQDDRCGQVQGSQVQAAANRMDPMWMLSKRRPPGQGRFDADLRNIDCGSASNRNERPDEAVLLRTRLQGTIENEIIPRLMLAYGGGRLPELEEQPLPTPTNEQVIELAEMAVRENVRTLRAHVEGFIARGMPLPDVFLGLLAPAARHLGEQWTKDLCDFTSVTIGLTNLQQVVHSFGAAFSSSREVVPDSKAVRNVLLIPAPGEQHTFGLILVTEFFRRAGWQVTSAPSIESEDLIDAVKARHFDIVGFSLSSEDHFDKVRRIIGRVKRSSINGAVRVMVGGQAIGDRQDHAEALGADASAVDGRRAVARASKLLDLVTNR